MEISGDLEQEKIIDELQTWFEKHPKLPKKINRILLTRFYYCMFKDVKETKNLLKTNYSLRQNAGDVFIQRDPSDKDTQASAAYADMVFLPGLTPDKYRASVLRISDPDPNKMDHLRDIKTYFMVSDYRFALPDAQDPTTGLDLLAQGEIIIIDMANFTMKHMTRVSIRALRICINYLQRGYPVRIKSIHLINCPPYMNRILSIVRPFINKQILELIHFHNDNLELLYNYVPKEMLTEEYGGPCPKMSDHKDQLLQSLIDTRNYLMDHDYWKV